MNKKKLIILISIIIALAVLACVGIFALSGNKASKIADKLDMGEKYLEELEYEKALAVYKEILEIDPKNVDAYLGLVDTFIAMGEYEFALECAEDGYEETGDKKLKAKIAEVEALIAGAQATPAPTPEVTPEPTPEPTATPEPTPEPLPEGLLEGTEALEIKVPDGVSVMNSNGGVIITQKDGLYGAMNYAGEEIVPNIYSVYYRTPNDQGYFALAEGDYGYGVHVFNKDGGEELVATLNRLAFFEDKVLYSSNSKWYETNDVYTMIALYDMTKDEWLYWEDAYHDGGDFNSFIGIVSDKGDFYYTDNSTGVIYQIVLGADGKGTKEPIYGAGETSEIPETTEQEPSTNMQGNGTSGTIGSLNGEAGGSGGGVVNGGSMGTYYLWSHFSNGYARGNGNSAADCSILMSEDRTEVYWFMPYQIWQSWDYSDKSYFDNGMWKYNTGKLLVQCLQDPETGETTYGLIDLSRAVCNEDGFVQNPEELLVATYDSITLSDSPYYLAGEDGNWFYIDATGQIVYDDCLDCSSFYGGYAMIIAGNGRAYMIDEQFNKVAGGYEATGVYTAGGIFCINQSDGAVYLAPPTP